MGLRVNTNVMSLNAQRELFSVTERLSGNYKRLSSGLRISTGSDDAAGLGISERMRAQIRSYQQASRNAQDGVSLVQTAEGALAEVNSNLVRMRELAIQAANGTLNTGDRLAVDNEFQQLIDEIDRIASTTDFNGIPLLNDTTGLVTKEIQVGTEKDETVIISMVDMTEVGLGLSASTFNLTSVSSAADALDILDTAIDSVTNARSDLGATQNRLQSSLRSTQVATENLSASESRIRDVDVASETADLTRNSILQQAAASVLAQANAQPQLALSLLQG